MRAITSEIWSDSATDWLMASPSSFISFFSSSSTLPPETSVYLERVGAEFWLLEYAFNPNVCAKREQTRGPARFQPPGPRRAAGRRAKDRPEPLGPRPLSWRQCHRRQRGTRVPCPLARSHGLPVHRAGRDWRRRNGARIPSLRGRHHHPRQGLPGRRVHLGVSLFRSEFLLALAEKGQEKLVSDQQIGRASCRERV